MPREYYKQSMHCGKSEILRRIINYELAIYVWLTDFALHSTIVKQPNGVTSLHVLLQNHSTCDSTSVA